MPLQYAECPDCRGTSIDLYDKLRRDPTLAPATPENTPCRHPDCRDGKVIISVDESGNPLLL